MQLGIDMFAYLRTAISKTYIFYLEYLLICRFAKDGDYRGVEIMFTYYGESLMPHWLTITSFFPETSNPSDYKKLLPECDPEGQLFLLDQCELRQKDWSEKLEFNEIINLDVNDRSEILHELDSSSPIYR